MATTEFKYRSLTQEEKDAGPRCVHVLFSRMACGRLATKMYWAPIKPEVAQTYCEAHVMIEKVQFEQFQREGHEDWVITDLDALQAEEDRKKEFEGEEENPFEALAGNEDVGVKHFKEEHKGFGEKVEPKTNETKLNPEPEKEEKEKDKPEHKPEPPKKEEPKKPETPPARPSNPANPSRPLPPAPAKPEPEKKKSLAEVIAERRSGTKVQPV